MFQFLFFGNETSNELAISTAAIARVTVTFAAATAAAITIAATFTVAAMSSSKSWMSFRLMHFYLLTSGN